MIKNLKVPLSFDFSDLWDYDYLKTVSPHIDFALFSCSEMQKPEMETLIQCVMDYGCKLFIGTLGKTGVLVTDGKRRFIKKPYQLRDPVIDTLGAGDAFVTGFL